MEEVGFTVECNCCKQWLDNWVGSTPCCGSVAYRLKKDDTGEVSKDFFMFAQIGGEKLKQ